MDLCAVATAEIETIVSSVASRCTRRLRPVRPVVATTATGTAVLVGAVDIAAIGSVAVRAASPSGSSPARSGVTLRSTAATYAARRFDGANTARCLTAIHRVAYISRRSTLSAAGAY
jgi:hypothetical protein